MGIRVMTEARRPMFPQPPWSHWLRFFRLLRGLTVDAPRNTHVCFGMLDQNHVDDLGIRTDRLMGYLDNVPDQLRLAGLGKAGGIQ
jgi:hypothetical protein